MEKCEHCGETEFVNNCIVCGAPVCCPKCCKEMLEEMEMEYRGYIFYIHPTWTEFGARICFISHYGLTITKAVGATEEAAVEAAERWVDARLAAAVEVTAVR